MEKIDYNITTISQNNDGEEINILFKIPHSFGWIERVRYVIETNNNTRTIYTLDFKKNDGDYAYFSNNIFLPTNAIYHYYFTYEANGKYKIFKKENLTNPQSISLDEMWKKSVNFHVPEWAQGKIMYQIFVDRFNKGRQIELPPMDRRVIHKDWNEEQLYGPILKYNDKEIWNIDFYGGDLKGIEQKLDYIKSLGVTIIYLCPIMYSQSNHRYDTSDYEQVDPYAGTNEDLKSLCNIAHQKGMKIILDAVFNHTGNDSKYFNEFNSFNELGAYQSKESKYYQFYRTYYANNKDRFCYWWGMTNLPECNGNNQEWQKYIYGEGGIIDKWFSLGIDGLRLDVADELTDEFIEGIKTAVKRNKPDGFVIGEVWKNPMRMNRSYIESGKGMDSVMNYYLIDALIRYFKYQDVNKLAEIIRQIRTEYPKDTINSLMNFTSTHDISRAINIFATNQFQEYGEWAWNPNKNDLNWLKDFHLTKEEYEYGKQIYKAYLYTLAFLPGNLSIFYGDEIGMEGMGNLANRKPFDFTKADLELLNFFRIIGNIRRKEQFLEQADLNIIDINNNYFMFERINEKSQALITINRTDKNIPINIPSNYINLEAIYRLNNSTKDELNPYGGIVLKKHL